MYPRKPAVRSPAPVCDARSFHLMRRRVFQKLVIVHLVGAGVSWFDSWVGVFPRSPAELPYFKIPFFWGFVRFGGWSFLLRDGFDQIELPHVEINFRPHFMAHMLQSFTGNAFSPITRSRNGYFTTRRRFLTFMLPGSCLDAVLR